MNMRNQSNNSDDEGQQPPREHHRVPEMNDPALSAKRVRYHRTGAARIDLMDDSVNEVSSNSSTSNSSTNGGASSMARTRRHSSSNDRIIAAPTCAAKKPISPASHELMAKRRQMYLFRMQERRRVQCFRETAVLQMAKNMLSPEELKEMEKAVAEKKRKQQQEQYRRKNSVCVALVLDDTKESNSHEKQT